MTDKKGLLGIWEDIGSYLNVNVDVIPDQSPDAKYPAILHFWVTNTATSQEDQPDIVYDEIKLKVGIPPNWHIEKSENLTGGQSFSYDHPCNYADIAKIQWTVEGKVSPAVLLNFRQRPSMIPGQEKLPIKAYFDHLNDLNLHQWLEGALNNLSAPGPDTTLCEMKAEENSLKGIVADIRDTVRQIKDFLKYVDYKKYRDDIVHHKHLVEEYLKRTEVEIVELKKMYRSKRTDEIAGIHDKIVANLSNMAARLNEATSTLAQKVGVLKIDTDKKDSASAKRKV